jgi:hypothetical protein
MAGIDDAQVRRTCRPDAVRLVETFSGQDVRHPEPLKARTQERPMFGTSV